MEWFYHSNFFVIEISIVKKPKTKEQERRLTNEMDFDFIKREYTLTFMMIKHEID